MIHRYYYDADNRIVDVETSQDGFYYNTDAHYIYYDHGPLARVELANEKVQGTDFAYTIQGWQKAVNAAKLDEVLDMGKDGAAESLAPGGNNYNAMTGKDAYGFALTYYNDNATEVDYEQIKTTTWTPDPMADLNTSRPVGPNGLYNGNIAQMSTAMMDENEQIIPLISNDYTYDQVQRIKSMTSHESGTTPGTDYDYASATGNTYASTYSFDPNGNLETLTRKNGAGTLIDDFIYHDVNGSANNKLEFVQDDAGSFGNDLADQSSNNYDYNAVGQLIQDNAEEIEEIEWTTQGKVARIIRNNTSSKPDVVFKYDPQGNRSLKIEQPRSGGDLTHPEEWKYTFYTRDAQGNVMATYDMKIEDLELGYIREKFYLSERNIYGSERIGVMKSNSYIAERIFYGKFPESGGFTEADTSTATTTYQMDQTQISSPFLAYNNKRGEKFFELSNHLGNVLEVITDRKLPEPDGQNGIDHYVADVVSYSDYYPGGMIMPGRSGNETEYRYGAANGQEKVDEISGSGNHYTAQYWEYDSRLMRRWNTDPVFKSHESPYATFANNPIWFTDPYGADTVEVFESNGKINNHIETDEGDDVFFLVSKDDEGNIIRGKQKSFDEGTLLEVRDGEAPKGGDLYNLRGDKNSEKLFEFFADNIDREFSLFKTGLEGAKGLNFITTSHEKSTEKGATWLFDTQLKDGYTIREHTHNHPSGIAYPSGSDVIEMDGNLLMPGEWGDIGVAIKFTNEQKGKGEIVFKVYSSKGSKYRTYNTIIEYLK